MESRMSDGTDGSGPFDVKGVYALGNAWSQFGDALNQGIQSLQASMEGIAWRGEGAVAAGAAWNLIYAQVLRPLPEMCWNIGEEINIYGTKAEQLEKEIQKEQDIEMIASIFGDIFGVGIF